MQTKAML
jgi:WD40 repeat protein